VHLYETHLTVANTEASSFAGLRRDPPSLKLWRGRQDGAAGGTTEHRTYYGVGSGG